MNKLKLPNYNLEKTLLGGQSHSWDKINDAYYGFTQHNIIKITPKNNDEILWQTYPKKDNFEFLKNYLRLDIDIENIKRIISKDNYVAESIKTNPDLRILGQDFEETLLIFILTQHKNIKAIRKCVRDVAKKFGERIVVDDIEFFLFPEAEVLNNLTETELKTTGIGFRAKYIKDAARILTETDLNQRIYDLNEQEAREALTQIHGVGDKVSDCVLSFALKFDNITPLDVWSKRILTSLYKLDPKMKYEDMRRWIDDYFEGYAAWGGHYLWEYVRVHPQVLQ